MKISVIYFSNGGNTEKCAAAVCEGAAEEGSVEVRAMKIDEIDAEFAAASSAVIIGSPSYCGTYSWQTKKWFDTTGLDLSGKLGSIFVSEDYIGGGADVAELGIAGMMLVRGMLVYSGGFTKGQPFTHLGAVSIKAGDDHQQERLRVLGRRVAEKAIELFRKQ